MRGRAWSLRWGWNVFVITSYSNWWSEGGSSFEKGKRVGSVILSFESLMKDKIREHIRQKFVEKRWFRTWEFWDLGVGSWEFSDLGLLVPLL